MSPTFEPVLEVADPKLEDISHKVNVLISEHRILREDGKLNPLDDLAFEGLATILEENGGTHPLINMHLKRVIIDQNCKLREGDTMPVTEAQTLRVRLRSSQEDDLDEMVKLRRKYGAKYPKTFEQLEASRTLRVA